MVLAFLALLTAPTKANCPVSAEELGQQAAQAVAAYERLDVERFQALAQDLGAFVPCLEGTVSAEQAAQVHLVMGLEAWSRREDEQVQAALRALLSVQPDYQPSIIVAPQGGGLLAAFEQARKAGKGKAESFQGLTLMVDGQRGASLPLERAALVQWNQPAGQLESRYAWQGELADELRVVAQAVQPEGKTRRVDHLSRRLVVASAFTGLVAGLSARQANYAHSAFQNTDSWEDAQQYYTQNRAFAVGSGVATAGALGLAVGAVVVWEW